MKQLALRSAVLAALLFAAALTYGWFQLTQPFVQAIAAPPTAGADSAKLKKHVEKLALDFPDRRYDNLVQLDGAAAYIESQFKALGLSVHSQRFVAEGRPYRNLIVQLGPETADVVVVGAHYDVAGDQPGADDNASGVAGLLELARLLQAQPLQRRIELVAFTNEEPPFFRTPHMGSAVHAKSLKAQGKRVSLMLSLECIGYFSDAPSSQLHPFRLLNSVYPSVGNFIALVGHYDDGALARRVKSAMMSASDLPVHSINAPGFVVGMDFSLHLNYWNEGFVGMMVTDTAFFRNKAYHTPQDTPERLDYVRMAKVVDGVRAVMAQREFLR